MSIRYGISILCLVTCAVLTAFNTHAQTEKAPQKMATLLELAEAKFGPLETDHPFRRLVDAVTNEVPAVYSNRAGGDLDVNVPLDKWDPKIVLSAEHIVWLCTQRNADNAISERGILIVGARIEGTLDLSFSTLPFPLALHNCSIVNGLNMYQASVKALILSGSHLGKAAYTGHALSAHAIVVEGHLLLAKGFTSYGEVNLVGAKIGGVLDCGSATLNNQDGNSIDAQGATIGGSIFLYDGFASYGNFRISGAKVGGQLLCSNSNLSNPGRQALNADGAVINNAVIITDGFSSHGEFRLVGATLNGGLECNGVSIDCPDDIALNAFGATINGSVYFKNGCAFKGEIRLGDAQIDGSLEIENTSILNPKGKTLDLQKADVKGAVFIAEKSQSTGEMSMAGAKIGSNLEFSGSTLENSTPSGRALFADGITIGGAMFFINRFSAGGEISLGSAHIRSNVECKDVALNNAPNTTLNLHNSVIGGALLLSTGFVSNGTVNLIRAKIDSDVDFMGATLDNPKNSSLVADRAVIFGNISLNRGFKSQGQIVLFGAEISGDLDFTGAVIQNVGGPILNAGNCKVGGSVVLQKGFVFDGMVDFTGMNVEASFQLRDRSIPQNDLFRLNMQHASVRTLSDETESWPIASGYNIDGFKYRFLDSGSPQDFSSRIDWVKGSHSGTTSFQPAPYTQLASFFEDSELNSIAREVRIARERERTRHTESFFLRNYYIFSDILVAFGYKPWLAVRAAIVFNIIGVLIFCIAGHYKKMVPSDSSALIEFRDGGTVPRNYPAFQPIIYTVDTFLPIIALQQSSYWVPANNSVPPWRWQWILEWNGPQVRQWLWTWIQPCNWIWRFQWLLIVTGWVISTFLVASLTGIIKQ